MSGLKHATFVAALAALLAQGALAQDATYRDFDKSGDSTRGDPQDRYQENKREFNQSVKRGTDALKTGDYAAANGYFTDALELDPNNAGACYLMALAKIGLGKKGEAVGFLDKAVAADPTYVDARALLAKLLLQGGDRQGALEQLEALRAMRGSCVGRCTDGGLAGAISQLETMLA